MSEVEGVNEQIIAESAQAEETAVSTIEEQPSEEIGANEQESAAPAAEETARDLSRDAEQAAARRRREEEVRIQAAIDAEYARMCAGEVNKFTGKPINTKADYIEYSRQLNIERQAQESGISYAEQERVLSEMKEQLVSSDPEISSALRERDELLAERNARVYTETLERIKAAYPDEKAASVEEFGVPFAAMCAQGVDPLVAYEALRNDKLRSASKQPSTGDVSAEPISDGEFFSAEQVKRMTPAEVKKHYSKIRESMKNWKKE